MAREVAAPLELEEERIERPPLWRRLLNMAQRHPLGLFGLLTLGLLIFAGVFANVISPYDPQAIDRTALLHGPTLSHPFGTDRLGRDVLSRTIFGARISLMIGMVSIFFGVTIGAFLGVVSGYFGRFVDSLIQRSVDVLLAFPAIVLMLAIVTVFGDEDSAARRFLAEKTPVPEGSFLGVPFFLDIFILSLAIGVAVIASVARVTRGAVLSIKENVYIEAARALGATDARIMWHHIFPNVVALVVILASITLPLAILAEAAISFLGIGVPAPTPSWGADLTGQNRDTALSGYWWPVFFPGLALSLVVLGFNMLGDAFRDISDPRLRGAGGSSGSREL
jgi:peptide/nickel transport system permease protein